jgi:salicylate hydroxylase
MSGNTPSKVDVAIIGGGIGGLSTALALHKIGFDAHVFEQAPAYGEVGGHLTMDEAAIAVLKTFDLDQAFLDIGCHLDGMEVRAMDTGEVAVHMPLPDLGSMGVKDKSRMGGRVAYAFLRTDYLNICTSRLPEGRLHTGHKLTGLSGDADSATAVFENGSTVTAKIMLAADGVRSLARQEFDNTDATFTKHSVLRTLCSADLLPNDMPNDRMRFWDGWKFGDKAAGVGVHVLTVPVRDNKFVSVDIQFMGGDQLQDCSPQDLPIERVMARFPDSLDAVVKEMIDKRVEPIAAYPLYDRPVANKWVENRIALIGDAAHSMRPNLGQGACQSVHDAGELAKSFAEHGLTNKALLAYEAVRKPYTQSVVESAMKTKIDPKAWKKAIDEGKVPPQT